MLLAMVQDDLQVIVGTFCRRPRAEFCQVRLATLASLGLDVFSTGFPLMMSEIQAQVTVADVNADGVLEMITVDVQRSKSGKDLWGRMCPASWPKAIATQRCMASST